MEVHGSVLIESGEVVRHVSPETLRTTPVTRSEAALAIRRVRLDPEDRGFYIGPPATPEQH